MFSLAPGFAAVTPCPAALLSLYQQLHFRSVTQPYTQEDFAQESQSQPSDLNAEKPSSAFHKLQAPNRHGGNIKIEE
ncbi:hypothetical protein BDR05DRAFT_965290 [Suillus weaverae]|nr:hypothetical protein BDR05DRAFT_965290 [Suillus weaverae]